MNEKKTYIHCDGSINWSIVLGGFCMGIKAVMKHECGDKGCYLSDEGSKEAKVGEMVSSLLGLCLMLDLNIEEVSKEFGLCLVATPEPPLPTTVQ